MNEIGREKLLNFIARLNEAGHGGKGAVFDECADWFGCSRQKAIRLLKEFGYETKRKPRSDKGKTSVSEETITLVAAIQRSGTTKNGKDTMHVTGAYAVAKNSGAGLDISVARARQLLRDRRLDRKSLNRPAPYVHMRSLHPNHVHQVDPSLSRLYYAPGGIAMIKNAEANRNKVQGFKKLKLWRYVLTDHYSGSVCIRYYETSGETQSNLYDFLLYAWGKKEHELFLFHGVPDILMCDSGSANISRAMTYALKALDVRTIAHGVEKPRVKGQVEKYNDAAETFEAWLRLQPQMSVDAINLAAEKWCALYNACKIPGYNSKLKRNGIEINRLKSWLTISQEQLRELPPLPVCRDLLTREPRRVVVCGDLFLQYEGRTYSLAGLPGVYVGMEVFIQPLLMRENNVLRVHYTNDAREEISIEVYPLTVDENSGFLADGPVIGQEFKAHKKTILERKAEQLDELIGNQTTPFGGEIKALSALDNHESKSVFMPRSSVPISISGARVFENTLTPVQATRRLKQSLGFWDSGCMEYLQKNYPDGVLESDIPSIESTLRGVAHENDVAQTHVA